MGRTFIAALAVVFFAANAAAAIHTETVDYREGDTILRGYLAYDDASIGVVVSTPDTRTNAYPPCEALAQDSA